MAQSVREYCGLPVQLELQELVLDLLRGMPMPATKAQVGSAAADRLNLSEVQRAVREPKGRYSYVEWQVGWVLSQLKLVGFLEQPEPGYWRLTDDGHRLSFEAFRRRHIKRERTKRAARGRR